MTRTTQELRQLWAPACEGPWARVELYGFAAVSVDPLIVSAVKALDACLRYAKYESDREDTGAYNCRAITGGGIDPSTGQIRKSLHAYGIAIDLNWNENPYQSPAHVARYGLITDMPPAMIRAIEAIRTKGGAVVWRWGGRYTGNRDTMHWEVVASPAELARGIDPATLPGGSSATPTEPTNPKGALMALSDEEQDHLLATTNENNLRLIAIQKMLEGDDLNGKGTMPERTISSLKRVETELAKVPKTAKPKAPAAPAAAGAKAAGAAAPADPK